MGRPSKRTERRRMLAEAFVRVLAEHGPAAATIAALADEAGVQPGLIHHYFRDKQDLYRETLAVLASRFSARIAARQGSDASDTYIDTYIDAALTLDERSDIAAARAWVGLFSEALHDAALFDRIRRLLDAEVASLCRRGALSTADASAILTFVLGALVFGAFAPRKTQGFAAPSLRKMRRAQTERNNGDR